MLPVMEDLRHAYIALLFCIAQTSVQETLAASMATLVTEWYSVRRYLSIPATSMVRMHWFPVESHLPCLAQMRNTTRKEGNDSTAPSHN